MSLLDCMRSFELLAANDAPLYLKLPVCGSIGDVVLPRDDL